MPLTPAEVHNAKFRKPPMGKRGYDEDEVDSFLDRVEAELVRLLNENADLQRQLETIGQAGTSESASAGPAGEAAAPAVRQALAGAEGDAEQAALRTLVLAQRTADAAVSEARGEATDLVTQARAEAERLEREARERTEALDRDAESRYQQAIGGLEEARRALERRIEDLHGFEREYRSRLRAYLETQLRELEGRAAGATPQTPAAQSPAAQASAAQASGAQPSTAPAEASPTASDGDSPFTAAPAPVVSGGTAADNGSSHPA